MECWVTGIKTIEIEQTSYCTSFMTLFLKKTERGTRFGRVGKSVLNRRNRKREADV